MKKLAVILLITIVQFSFSQSRKVINGSVFSQNLLIPDAEIINLSTERSTTTNANGEFSIAAKINDSILIFHKDYELKGIKISSDDLNTTKIKIEITRKAEELKEVVVHQVNIDWKLDKKWEKEKNHEIAMEKKAKALKNSGVYNGTIENGMDFVKIGKMIFGDLFKGKKEKAENPDAFKEIAAANFDQKFYTETLQLKKEEMEAFLTFCNFDPESKKMLSKNSNNLELMDFLYKKSVEFKKINAPE
nr:carboxypeptidase-like regulatory domain-containing protein [uncultured Flavobacterium sp.]